MMFMASGVGGAIGHAGGSTALQPAASVAKRSPASGVWPISCVLGVSTLLWADSCPSLRCLQSKGSSVPDAAPTVAASPSAPDRSDFEFFSSGHADVCDVVNEMASSWPLSEPAGKGGALGSGSAGPASHQSLPAASCSTPQLRATS